MCCGRPRLPKLVDSWVTRVEQTTTPNPPRAAFQKYARRLGKQLNLYAPRFP
jgi:hypothetical protein